MSESCVRSEPVSESYLHRRLSRSLLNNKYFSFSVISFVLLNLSLSGNLIYLRGIQSYEMESILQFMYLGEGRLFYERMGEFIKVAKELEVKGVEIPN